MKLYLGTIAAYNKDNHVFLYTNEETITKKTKNIILRASDFDIAWINRLTTTSSKNEKDIFMLDSENQYFMQLYLLFSLRNRLYYLDIFNIATMEYAPKNLLYHKDVQLYLWEQLCLFMQKNNYCFKVIKSIPSLYEERPFVPLAKYSVSNFFCLSGTNMLFNIFKRLTIRYIIYLTMNLNRRLHLNEATKKLRTNYTNIKNIKSDGQSGCLFFSGYDENNDKLFIKFGTIPGADIENEFKICNLLSKHTNHNDLYLLPKLDKSSPNMLVFPFVNGCSLKDLILKRNLTIDETKKLLTFLDNVLADLYKCQIIHRDIHFDNILCCINPSTNKIDSFLLTDFGCAIIKNTHALNNTIKQKRKNQYAGSIYRFSKYSWDDAASSAYVIMQNIDINLIDNTLINRILSYIGKSNYTLK